jgi:aminopeptidase-like protein
MMLKAILEKIYPLHRTLACEGTDEALRVIGEHMPAEANYQWETYTPNAPVWTWRVPERYLVHQAYLESEEGEHIVDFADNPLHLVSYSLPVDQWLSWEQLEPHLHYDEKRPHAIPWVFKYYQRDWGFCLPKATFDRLDRRARYRAVIRAEFITDPKQGFRLGVGVLHPEGEQIPSRGSCSSAPTSVTPCRPTTTPRGWSPSSGWHNVWQRSRFPQAR